MQHEQQIFLLMEGATPVGAYTDKALADVDCYSCNDAQRYLDVEQFNYWVKAMTLTTEPFPYEV